MRSDLSIDIELAEQEYAVPDIELIRAEALQQADNILSVGIFSTPTENKRRECAPEKRSSFDRS